MWRTLRRLIGCVLVLGSTGATTAAQSASQSVTIIIEEVNTLSVNSDVSMALPASPGRPAPGSEGTPTATYAFSTNGYGKKITGQLGAGFTPHLALDVALAAPAASGSSLGPRTLDRARAVDLVTDLSRVTQRGLGVRYTVSPTGDAAPSGEPGAAQTVTFTMTDR